MPYRFRVLALLCALTTLTYLDRVCISLVGVRMKADLGLTNVQFGWVLAAFALAYALFEIPVGAWGDRIGPRLVFIRIVVWWSAFTALTGLVSGLAALLLIRFLFGVGEAGTMPNAVLVISRWFPAQEMGRALPWMGIGTQIGAAVAPLYIIPLAAAFGWRVPFYFNGLLGLGWVAVCFFWFRNFPEEMKKIRPMEVQHILASRRHHTGHPLLGFRTIFSQRTLWALMLMYFCLQWANYFFIAWFPIYVQETLHFSESQTPAILFLMFLVGIIGLLIGGYCIDQAASRWGLVRGRRLLGMGGMIACGLSILLAGLTANPNWSAGWIIAANGWYSFGVMSGFAVCSDIGRNNAGTVTGAMNSSGQIGAFFLAIVFGNLIGKGHSGALGLQVIATVILAGSLLWLWINPAHPIRQRTLD